MRSPPSIPERGAERSAQPRMNGFRDASGGPASWALPPRSALYFALLAAAHLLGYGLRLPGQELTTFWPPAGVALAILAIERRGLWPFHVTWFIALEVAFALLVYDSGDHPGWALYFAVINACEAIFAVWLLHRLGMLPLDVSRVWSYAGFAATACFCVPAVFALGGAYGVTTLTEESFSVAWSRWWLGDALGIMILVPAVHGFLRGAFPLVPHASGALEGALFIALFSIFGALSCGLVMPFASEFLHIEHIVVPFLVWAALRFNWRAVSWTLLAAGWLVVRQASVGGSQFGNAESTGQDVYTIQLFLAATGIPSMLLGAFVSGLKDQREALVEEIAARERAEARRVRLERALREARQSEVVGNLAAGVAHDVSNMLTVLTGHTQLLERRHGHDPDSRASLEALQHAVAHVMNLVQSLLTISRRTDAPHEPCDLGELVSETVPLIGRAVPSGSRVVYERPTSPVPLVADVGLVKQALVNLCLNAGEAMRERGGEVRISVEVAGTGAEQFARLSVNDQGCGMNDAVRARIFEPFYTGTEGGTGLGLSVVEACAKQHGGRVEVRTEIGRGSTFTMTLPLADGSGGLDHAGMRARGRGEVVLVVEDDERIREMVSGALRRAGFESIEAPSAERVLELAESGALLVDALVLDVNLPGLGGVECLRRLRDRGEKAPALVITGDPGAFDATAKELGATLLTKPFRASELTQLVREQIDAANDRLPTPLGPD